MSPARLLLMVNSLQRAGSERNVVAICHHIDRSRFQPEVWTLAEGGEYEQTVRDAGVPIHCLHRKRAYGPMFAARAARDDRGQRRRSDACIFSGDHVLRGAVAGLVRRQAALGVYRGDVGSTALDATGASLSAAAMLGFYGQQRSLPGLPGVAGRSAGTYPLDSQRPRAGQVSPAAGFRRGAGRHRSAAGRANGDLRRPFDRHQAGLRPDRRGSPGGWGKPRAPSRDRRRRAKKSRVAGANRCRGTQRYCTIPRGAGRRGRLAPQRRLVCVSLGSRGACRTR